MRIRAEGAVLSDAVKGGMAKHRHVAFEPEEVRRPNTLQGLSGISFPARRVREFCPECAENAYLATQ